MKTTKFGGKKHGVRYCSVCKTKLQKNGTECGKQRWRCPSCKTAKILKRPDIANRNREQTHRNYLLSKETAKDTAKRHRISHRTFTRNYSSIKRSGSCHAPIGQSGADKRQFTYCPYLVIDATGLNHEVVAIVHSGKVVLTWRFASYESSLLWEQTLYGFNALAIVSDGQKGIQKAIANLWGDSVILQRCHFHVKQNMRTKLTNNPESEAGKDLKWLVSFMGHVKDEHRMAVFVGIFNELYEQHHSFLSERTFSKNPDSKHKWFYTHRRVRSAYRQIADLIARDQLFAYITHPELNLPNTTNCVEGGINARLGELIRAHRGMFPERQRLLVVEFLRSKMERDVTSKANA